MLATLVRALSGLGKDGLIGALRGRIRAIGELRLKIRGFWMTYLIIIKSNG